MPRSIAAVCGAGMATLAECSTVLSLRDVYNLLELMQVQNYNRKLMREHEKDK